jgi:hypothetical protein
MSAHGNRIWVVITDGVSTRICSSQDGMATPIATPVFNLGSTNPDERDLAAYKAWFKADGRHRLGRNPRREHVLHVSQLLLEAARDRAYDGLIIIAAEPAAAELKEALAPETRALLMGRVVRDLAGFDAPAPCKPAEMRH